MSIQLSITFQTGYLNANVLSVVGAIAEDTRVKSYCSDFASVVISEIRVTVLVNNIDDRFLRVGLIPSNYAQPTTKAAAGSLPQQDSFTSNAQTPTSRAFVYRQATDGSPSVANGTRFVHGLEWDLNARGSRFGYPRVCICQLGADAKDDSKVATLIVEADLVVSGQSFGSNL